MKRTVSEAEVRRDLEKILEAVDQRGDEITIEREGRPLAVLVRSERHGAAAVRGDLFEIIRNVHERNRDEPDDLMQAEIDQTFREMQDEDFERTQR